MCKHGKKSSVATKWIWLIGLVVLVVRRYRHKGRHRGKYTPPKHAGHVACFPGLGFCVGELRTLPITMFGAASEEDGEEEADTESFRAAQVRNGTLRFSEMGEFSEIEWDARNAALNDPAMVPPLLSEELKGINFEVPNDKQLLAALL